jgi:hypothetical protein
VENFVSIKISTSRGGVLFNGSHGWEKGEGLSLWRNKKENGGKGWERWERWEGDN